MALESAEAAAQTKIFIKNANGNSTWDRLDEYLEKSEHGREVFVYHRNFDGPIDLLYELWANPDHLAKWLAPTGFQMEFLRRDLRVGGRSFYKMFNQQGMTMYGSTTYKEFVKNQRIVYAQDFHDAEDRLARHPMAPTWPASMATTVTFTAEGPQETRIRVEWQPATDATAEEVAVFLGQRPGMTMGWKGSFDKLEEAVAANS